ncbi:MAG: hypothetical protein PHZ02_01435 [Desulfocapsaceae bacterium]|nr:hypothetical protein [Desulfocapsaceae bacterium]
MTIIWRVYLCGYHDSEDSTPDTLERREKFKHRTDLTDYPDYTFDSLLNNTQDYVSGCFVEVEPVL